MSAEVKEQIQLEMKLTATQFRVRKNRAINRALPRARAILADVRITRSSGNGAGLEFLLFKKFDT